MRLKQFTAAATSSELRYIPLYITSSVTSHFLFVFSAWRSGAGAGARTRRHARPVPWMNRLRETTAKFPPPGQPGWEKPLCLPHVAKPEPTVGGRVCFATRGRDTSPHADTAGARHGAGRPRCPELRSCGIVFQQFWGVCKHQPAGAAAEVNP